MIKVSNLHTSIDGIDILKEINLRVKKGSFVGLIGPNGCGKSTLVRNICKKLDSKASKIFLDGIDILEYDRKKFAQKLSFLPQNENIAFGFTVEEIVLMGRYSFSNSNIFSRKNDLISVHHALKQVGMLHLKDRNFLELSGGERQRVLIARAFSQESELLVLDEPTNHLDIKYQLQIMDILKNSHEKTVIAVIHDINIASTYCDYIIAMKDGKIVLEGTPEEVFTKENVELIFDLPVSVIKHPLKNNPIIIYH